MEPSHNKCQRGLLRPFYLWMPYNTNKGTDSKEFPVIEPQKMWAPWFVSNCASEAKLPLKLFLEPPTTERHTQQIQLGIPFCSTRRFISIMAGGVGGSNCVTGDKSSVNTRIDWYVVRQQRGWRAMTIIIEKEQFSRRAIKIDCAPDNVWQVLIKLTDFNAKSQFVGLTNGCRKSIFNLWVNGSFLVAVV